MRHLSRDESMQAAEGSAERSGVPAAARAHLDDCSACRAEVDQLRATLRDAASLAVPEPSPLFWEHFSARVSQAVHAEEMQKERASRESRGWTPQWRAWPALAGSAVTALLVGVLAWQWSGAGSPVRVSPPASQRSVDVVLPNAAPGEDAEAREPGEEDESWSVLSTLLADSDTSEVLPETPGIADGAMLQLSDEERGELGRLLQAEIDRHRVRTGV
jgi:hypothetical protein